jgi:hypothetical protein
MGANTECDEHDDPGGPADDDARSQQAYGQGDDLYPDDSYPDEAAYWRRRFLVLACGLAIVGGVSWGLSALLGPARPVRVGGAAHPSLAIQDTLPPAALGYPAGVHPSSSTSASPARTARSSASPAVACAPSALVLSLFTPQGSYGPGEQPQFEVYAVSTAPGTCTLPFGASLVRVVVTRHGRVLWNSAACPTSTGAARQVRFTQGVPQVAARSWNRKASTAGCAGSVTPGTWGTVNAVALAYGQSSPVRSFTLSR